MLTNVDEINAHIWYFADETLLPKLLDIDKNITRIIPSFIDVMFDNYFGNYNNLIDLIIKLLKLEEIDLVNSFMNKIYQQDWNDFNAISVILIRKDLPLTKLFLLAAPNNFDWNGREIIYGGCDNELYKNLLRAIIETRCMTIANAGDMKCLINGFYLYSEELRPLAGVCKIMFSCQKLQRLLIDAQKQSPEIDSVQIINDLLLINT